MTYIIDYNPMKQDWEIKKLGDVANIKSGKSIDTSLISDDTSLYPCYGGNGIRGYVKNCRYDGCFPIIGRVGALCGNIHLARGQFNATEHALVVEITRKDIHAEWLTYNLISLKLHNIAKGVAQPVIAASEVEKQLISIPPFTKQEKIVTELNCLSNIIEWKKQQLEELDKLAQAIFYDMFGDPITNEKGWEMYKWDDVLRIINGKNQSKVEAISGEYPIYGSGGAMGRANSYLCPENTIILGRKGNINKPIYVKEKLWNVDTAFGLVANEHIIHSIYLYFYCIIYDFMQHNKAVTIPSLTKSDLLKIQIPIPPLSLQQQFAEKIEVIEKQKQLIKLTLKGLEELFNSRMDYYFN